MDASETLARWDIKALSPSSLLKWADDRCAWVLTYAMKSRDPASPAMARGGAVEAGLEALLRGFGPEVAAERMATLWALKCAEAGIDAESEEARNEFANLPPMLEQCALALKSKPLPLPNATQIRCEAWIEGDGWTCPLAGYADFVFDGWCLDLKTTKAMPSAPKPAHVAQVACYAKARGEEHAALLYVTPKKFAFYDVGAEEIDAAWAALQPHARSLLRALYRARDVDDLCADYPPPVDHWSWTADRRAAAVALVPAWAGKAA